MDNKNNGTLTDEVEVRLHDLFGESDETPVPVEDSGVSEDSPLRGLKTVLLSIDWEIDDEVMATLVKEIRRLEDTYKDDKNLLLFLQLLRSVGKYIKVRKANAHPGAIKLLNSVYNSLEIVLLSKSITEAEKKQILLVQVKEFKKLKEQIALRKADTVRKKEVRPPQEIKPVIEKKDVVAQARPTPPAETRQELLRSDMSRMTSQEALAHVLAEVKKVIRAEFNALKAELKGRSS